MRVMGFSRDPVCLPFVTVRTQKWANRLTVGEIIQIQGEHGCRLPKTPARVVAIDPHPGPCPEDLAHVPGYTSEQLFRIYLAPVSPGDPELARYMFPV